MALAAIFASLYQQYWEKMQERETDDGVRTEDRRSRHGGHVIKVAFSGAEAENSYVKLHLCLRPFGINLLTIETFLHCNVIKSMNIG